MAGAGQPLLPREGSRTLCCSSPCSFPCCTGCRLWAWIFFLIFFSLVFSGVVLRVTWSLSCLPGQEMPPVSESEWELFCIPVSSALSPTLLLPCFKFFSPTLRELTLLVNQGVIYFWLHLEIKYHLSYSL